MSKLPMISAKTLEKVLLLPGFKIIKQKGSQVFTGILMEDKLLFRIIRAWI
jgi:hypothetical protein